MSYLRFFLFTSLLFFSFSGEGQTRFFIEGQSILNKMGSSVKNESPDIHIQHYQTMRNNLGIGAEVKMIPFLSFSTQINVQIENNSWEKTFQRDVSSFKPGENFKAGDFRIERSHQYNLGWDGNVHFQLNKKNQLIAGCIHRKVNFFRSIVRHESYSEFFAHGLSEKYNVETPEWLGQLVWKHDWTENVAISLGCMIHAKREIRYQATSYQTNNGTREELGKTAIVSPLLTPVFALRIYPWEINTGYARYKPRLRRKK